MPIAPLALATRERKKMNSVVITVATPEGSQAYSYECHSNATLTAIVNGTVDSLSTNQHIGMIEVF